MAVLVGRLRDVAGTADEHKIIHWEGKHSGVFLELSKDEAKDIVLKVTDNDDVDDYKETEWLDKETLTEEINQLELVNPIEEEIETVGQL